MIDGIIFTVIQGQFGDKKERFNHDHEPEAEGGSLLMQWRSEYSHPERVARAC